MSLFLAPIDAEPAQPLRTWQAEALPLVLESIEAREEGIVVAVTGSGKSVLLAEVIAQRLLAGELGTIVVTTSSRRLVEQLAATIGERIGHGRVGRFYTSAKQATQAVIVACNNSAMALAAVFRRLDRSVALWVADEAHRTEAEGLTVAAHALKPAARVGFTATAFRSDDSETLQLFKRVIYRYGFGQALADKVIVPWKVIPWTGEEMPLDEAVARMVEAHGQGPGVVNATSIADAEGFAKLLTERGLAAEAVHSELTQAEQDGRLAALRDGRLRCIVYPSLLSEGADFPWLRWMCLRRNVQARVRFIQEVGRVLRVDKADPSKVEAIILDPIGLFQSFSLTYGEDLGEPEPKEPSLVEQPDRASGGGAPAQMTYVSPADAVSSWARQLYLAAQLDGVVSEKPAFILDRNGPATPAQARAVGKMAWAARYLAPDHQVVVKHLAANGDLPSRGTASDLLDVLGSVGKRRAAWVPSLPVLAPGLEVLELVRADIEGGGWFAAGACKNGIRAVAVLRGNRIVATGCKADDEAETNPLAVQVAAARLAARHAGEGATVHLHDEWAWKLLTGQALPHHPAVRAALDSQAPHVTYQLCPPNQNPAAGIAWREVTRHRKAS